MPKKEEETSEQKRSFKVFEKPKRLKKFEESPPKKEETTIQNSVKIFIFKKGIASNIRGNALEKKTPQQN